MAPFGLPVVTAEVRKGPSKLDGRTCIILDYARTSLVARGIQDELRLVRPGLYLGRAYAHGMFLLNFTLYNPEVADDAAEGFSDGAKIAEDCWAGEQIRQAGIQ